MDYVIVGSGPTGLTMAYLLAKVGKKCVILEESDRIGGCHSVKRQNGKFSEHGPRIYSESFTTFTSLLKHMGTSFHKLFTPYKFGSSDVSSSVFKNLTSYEIFRITKAYITTSLGFNTKNVSMAEYTDDFTDQAKLFIDRLCRVSDGTNIKNYSVYKFVQLINQQSLNKIYQPKMPNDEGLFKIWIEELEKLGVEIKTNTKVISLEKGVAKTNNGSVNGENIILAIPPKAITKIQNNYTPINQQWLKNNTYIDYITINLEWKKIIDLKSVWGVGSNTEWSIAHIILSDYFENYKGETLISVGVTNVDSPNNDGITARNADDETLKKEVIKQLKLIYPNMPTPDSIIIGSRIGQETAYIEGTSAKEEYLPFYTEKNIYNVGTHNGKSDYAFTTIETAVVNAYSLAHELEPQTKKYKITQAWTLNWVFLILLIIVLVGFDLYVWGTIQNLKEVLLQKSIIF